VPGSELMNSSSITQLVVFDPATSGAIVVGRPAASQAS
jgi:hypothetical protein